MEKKKIITFRIDIIGAVFQNASLISWAGILEITISLDISVLFKCKINVVRHLVIK